MRRIYKLLSWDYGTHRGVATDGTHYDGDPIEFTVMENDLEPEHNDHLLIDEIFSAEESPNHLLFDIVIEEGPRSVKEFTRSMLRELASNEQEPFDPNGNQVETSPQGLQQSIECRVRELERKMEYFINKFGDDGK